MHKPRVTTNCHNAKSATQNAKIASGESTDKGRTKDRHLREHECFADFAEGDAFRCLPQRSLEALDRLTNAFGAETESLMMDRHDEMSAGFIGHLHGLFRNGSGQCANRDGTVEPDRHQGCNARNLFARTHNPAAAKMLSRAVRRLGKFPDRLYGRIKFD
jgi:hypothetical protein